MKKLKGIDTSFRIDLSKFTEEEINFVIHEMSERMKDIVYVQSEARIIDCLKQLSGAVIEEDAAININYQIRFSYQWLVQIFGRVERLKNKDTKKIEFKLEEVY